MATIPSTMTGTLNGEGPWPGADLGVPSGVTPQIDNEVAEAVDDFGVLLEIGCGLHIADDPEPFRHAIELAQCFFQRREDGKPGQPSGLMSLLERDILADDPLHQGRSAVEGAVACDVGEAAMQLDWLEASEARHRRGKSDFELGQPVLDAPHLADTTAAIATAQSRVGSSNTRPRATTGTPTLVVGAMVTTCGRSVAMSSTAGRARSCRR